MTPMLNESWQNAVWTAIRRLKRSPKIAVMGIGHELRGDDAAGIMVVRAMPRRTKLLMIEAGTAPENHTGALRHFRPDLVLLIDAAQMNLAPGEIRALDARLLDGFNASTHTTPLTLLSHYVTAELGCDVLVIGIQPGNTALGAPLSPEVERAVEAVNQMLQSISGTDSARQL
jgi:hydrogenase 3 maturation protease